ELRAKLEAAGGASAAELEADIYNHLLAFFSRYYDEGDFISKRRYKGDVYAIPYAGEEVTLHWANKDQYYIKSGEWHKDYRFNVGNKAVRFRLVEATQETNNNKEADDAKRRYIIDAEKPVEDVGGDLTLRFQFRPPTEAEKQAAVEATRIFGGKYDATSGRTKGDEREQFCADAEQRSLAAMPVAWKPVVTAVAATDTKPARTILGKHLDHFTARNTFDYFIHKDLGGFLRREVDFYIKNEVVRLDDLESLPADHLARVQGKVKAIRGVAGRVIDFLARIEDFQRKMWLKKKLVLDTNWLVTVDRIPAGLRDTVNDSVEQRNEWESLGFKPGEGDATLLPGPKWGTREYLDANDKLVVDTRFFDNKFKADMLSDDTLLAGAKALDDAITGSLLNSENFQALALLQDVHRGQIACTYIDPPYNTDAGPIAYKNGFRDSSWLALIDDRITAAQVLTEESGILCVTIDDGEVHRLRLLLDCTLPMYELLGQVPIKNNPAGRTGTVGFSICHEYAIFLGRTGQSRVGRLEHNEAQIARYKERDALGPFEWTNFRKHGGQNTYRTTRPRQFYPIYVCGDTIRIPQMTWDNSARQYKVLEPAESGEEVILPVDEKGRDRIWDFIVNTAKDNIPHFRVRKDSQGQTAIYRKWRLNNQGILPKTWWDKSEYSAAEYGTNLLANLFGETHRFSFPKSVHAVAECLKVANLKTDQDGTALDYFAGSGTTGHAIINLNREDDGSRKFILIEMGAYFNTVLKPRIAKVLYSSDWKDGRAQVHGKGTSALVKYCTLESYEDALNNLPTMAGELLANAGPATRDAMVSYSLDLEMGPNLLNLDAFRDPWGYTINAQPPGEAEIGKHTVDLVETFNYLLGLKVRAYGPIERYAADFERAEHADNLGRLKVKGRLRRDKDGPFVFQRVEGELLDGTRVLVVWRTLSADAEQDAAALEAWMARHR
ncbi:MAG: DNA methyltransferase, partial [Planctomycetota bacterium]